MRIACRQDFSIQMEGIDASLQRFTQGYSLLRLLLTPELNYPHLHHSHRRMVRSIFFFLSFLSSRSSAYISIAVLLSVDFTETKWFYCDNVVVEENPSLWRFLFWLFPLITFLLGTWQVYRWRWCLFPFSDCIGLLGLNLPHRWKLELIENLNKNLAIPPQPLPSSMYLSLYVLVFRSAYVFVTQLSFYLSLSHSHAHTARRRMSASWLCSDSLCAGSTTTAKRCVSLRARATDRTATSSSRLSCSRTGTHRPPYAITMSCDVLCIPAPAPASASTCTYNSLRTCSYEPIKGYACF